MKAKDTIRSRYLREKELTPVSLNLAPGSLLDGAPIPHQMITFKNEVQLLEYISFCVD
jgi:hypothetical protein